MAITDIVTLKFQESLEILKPVVFCLLSAHTITTYSSMCLHLVLFYRMALNVLKSFRASVALLRLGGRPSLSSYFQLLYFPRSM